MEGLTRADGRDKDCFPIGNMRTHNELRVTLLPESKMANESDEVLSFYKHEGKERKRRTNGDYRNDSDTQCGIGKFHPACIQPLNNMCSFIFFSVGSILTSSTLSPYLVSQVTTLERQFNFSSASSGFILACNDIGFSLVVLFISHLFRNGHVPRILAVSTFIFGIGGLICALPFYLDTPKETINGQNVSDWLTSSYADPKNITDEDYMCKQQEKIMLTKNQNNTRSNVWALTLIAIGMVLQGVAKSVRRPMTTSYIDNNVKKTQTGKYIGIITAIGIFGPVVGFVVGTMCTKTYYNLKETNLSPEDPRWIGAWWLGYVIFGIAALVSTIPLIFFPRSQRKKPSSEDAIEMNEGRPETWTTTKNKKSEGNQAMKEIKKFFSSLRRIFQNVCCFLLLIGGGVDMMVSAGLFSFMAKYMETQYLFPAWKSNAILGTTTLVALSIGTLSGGMITSKAKLKARGCLTFICLCFALVAIFHASLLMVGCKFPAMVGPEIIPSRITYINGTIVPNCKQSCSCDDSKYLPVCSEDGTNYYSPCYAGCKSKNGTRYTDCSCLVAGSTVESGYCKNDCNHKIIYFSALLTLSALFGTMKIVPFSIAFIRMVEAKDKSLVIGVTSFLNSLLGWTFGPIVFGKLIDTTCLIWSSTVDSKQGSCVFYDTRRMKILNFSVSVGVSFLCGVIITIALFIFIKKENSKKYQAVKTVYHQDSIHQ
ncbi:solute carrier organic anion transporter family member 2A1 isoform X1 [Octopus bimaculoides]|uniref:Solute carrier organic anion transporter family member n=1 Tax=Octopus bimaculoides TaxID=37653 RepID=A0A0L8FIP4_OCTBM|nr:solute carrier organic anion transporter family member 2A1 isoform X1 [Octopus bimaculoides]|eukprot:XP_014789492.1 PREDICTED: solute carrier organic anion transporter family member 2A1-like isoform X1 [Octopus bimaculoides]